MLGDGLAHGPADLSVLDALLQRTLGDAHRAGRHIDPTDFQPAGGHHHALAFFAADEAELGRAAVVLEDELAGIDALVAQLFQLSTV